MNATSPLAIARLVGLGSVLLRLPLAAQEVPAIQVRLPGDRGETLRFRMEAAPEWATLFYRAAGEEEFHGLRMEPKDGGLEAPLAAGDVGSRTLQYYLAYKDGGGVHYLPTLAPKELLNLDLPAGPEGSKVAKGTVNPAKGFSFHVDGSLEQVVDRAIQGPGENIFLASGQIQLGYEGVWVEHHANLEARVVYTDQPTPGQSRWSVGELKGQYGYREHKIQAGDMALQESEFTIPNGGRRGFDYTYTSTTLYAHAFAVNSQRLPGFQGLIWPEGGVGVFGVALGYGWLDGKLRTKFVFVTGKDDPSKAINAGFSSFFTSREGSVGALVIDSSLLDNRLNFSGEYARSRYDADAQDAIGKVTDSAWRLGGTWTDSIFNARASYRVIGHDFGSVGIPILAGDRWGLDGGLGVSFSRWGFNLNAVSERNNPGGNPLETKAKHDVQNLDARWTGLPGLTFKTGFSHGEQEAEDPNNLQVPFANSRRVGAFAGLDWAFGTSGALTIQVQSDRLRSTGQVDTTGRSTTVTLGGAYAIGERLRMSPSFTWSRISDDATQEETRVTGAVLNGTLTLLANTLTLTFNGAYNRTQLPSGTAPWSSTVDGVLQYALDGHLGGRGRAVLALKGRYINRQDVPVHDHRLFLTLNFAF